MDRKEEYNLLLKELEEMPVELNYTMQRVEAKVKGKRWRKWVGIPMVSLMSCLLVFIVLVNSIPVFAKGCRKIPVIKELTDLVDFSPSLKEAVQQEYIQPIGQEQIQNNITANIEYLIVDQKQINIFYSLSSDIYKGLELYEADILNTDGSKMEGYGLSTGNHGTANGELNYMTIDFIEQDVPSEVKLVMDVYNNDEVMGEIEDKEDAKVHELEETFEEPTIISTFSFDLAFDPKYTATGEHIEVNAPITIDGQELKISEIEIYPTHMQFSIEDEEGNTAYMKGMNYYIENEKGEKFDKIKNGITSVGDKDSPLVVSYRLESSFFSQSKSLSLYITSAQWLDKEKQKIRLDLAHQTAEDLPEGICFEKAERKENGWLLTFSAAEYEENHHYQIWNSSYYDEEGNEYEYHSWSSNTGCIDEISEEYREEQGKFYTEIPLVDYTKDIVYMSPIFSYTTELEEPIVVKIKIK